jgi:hypothetical protein
LLSLRSAAWLVLQVEANVRFSYAGVVSLPNTITSILNAVAAIVFAFAAIGRATAQLVNAILKIKKTY